ncbi:MAG: sporulation protein YabP [Clostridiales bacterium]|nr:sporulation protein YabP [Clostridiales bacterium]
MPIEEKKAVNKTGHNFLLENRERMSVSGVVDVDIFNPDMIVVQTEMGMLTVKGNDLHINKLNLESAELIIDGEIASCIYSDKPVNTGASFISKIFK